MTGAGRRRGAGERSPGARSPALPFPNEFHSTVMRTSQIEVEHLLSSFVRGLHYVPSGARRIRLPEELPLSLRRITQQRGSAVWRAWGNGTRIWFVTARVVRRKYSPGLLVTFFDVDGREASAGVWIRSGRRGWMLSHPT